MSIRGMDYLISEKGKVYGMYRGEIKQHKTKDGYMRVTVGKLPVRTVMRVHRLVAEAFIANPKGLREVNHKDFDRTNNCVSNLEWCSHDYNIQYSYENNAETQYVARDGIKNGRSKLTELDVLNIRQYYSTGKYSIAALARQYNCGWQTINHIIKGTTWTHI